MMSFLICILIFKLFLRFLSFGGSSPRLQGTVLSFVNKILNKTFIKHINFCEPLSTKQLETIFNPFVRRAGFILLLTIVLLNYLFHNNTINIIFCDIALICILFHGSLKNWQEIREFLVFHKIHYLLKGFFVSLGFYLIIHFRHWLSIEDLFKDKNVNKALNIIDPVLPYIPILFLASMLILGLTALFLWIVNLLKKAMLLLWRSFLITCKELNPKSPVNSAVAIISGIFGEVIPIIFYIMD